MLPLVEKYRPKIIDNIILPEEYKNKFKEFIESGNIQNHLLFYGNPGTGKTTTAFTLIEQMGLEYMFINGSSERGMGVVRDKIIPYIKIQNLSNKHRIIFIDEADFFCAHPDGIMALRPEIEKAYKNVRFIFSANYINKFPKPILSRFMLYNFLPLKKDQMIDYIKEKILAKEKIEIDDSILEKIYVLSHGDMRKFINNIQKSLLNNKIVFVDDEIISKFINVFKNKNLNELKSFLQNNNVDFQVLYNLLYTKAKNSDQILYIAEYLYRDAMVIDSCINFVACICKLWGAKN